MYQKEIKQSNENIVFHSIYFTENSFSIPDLTKITNMTFPTIKRVINEFLERDIIKEWTLSTGGVGRRAVKYKYNPDFCYSIGVSIDEEKIKFIEKYSLEINSKRQWITRKNNTPERLYFSHKFILRNNILEIVFRKYQLCFAKLKYFRANIEKYDFYKHIPKEGFVRTELWDVEFFYHRKSKKIIDLR